MIRCSSIRKSALGLVSPLVLALGAQASTTWFVDVNAAPPGNGTPATPYASIQFAIDQVATVSGDTLLVLPGTYLESVHTQGKNLTLRSTEGPLATTIVGSLPGPVVTLNAGMPMFAPILEGFTVTGQIHSESLVNAGVYANSGDLRRCIVYGMNDVGSSGVFSGFDCYLRQCTIAFNATGVNNTNFVGCSFVQDSILFNEVNLYDTNVCSITWFTQIGGSESGFWNESPLDFHLRPGAAAINSGDPSHPHDPDGSVIDRGAVTFDPNYAPGPTNYCSGKLNSQGCVPSISAQGLASATSASPCLVQCDQAVTHKAGLLLYGFVEQSLPFQGGLLCVFQPHRTPAQNSGGGAACSGHWQFDMNARIQSGIDPNLVPGRIVFTQWWGRDPQDPAGFGSQLSDAIWFGIAP